MAKKVRDYYLYVEDIIDCIKKIERYTKGVSLEKFSHEDIIIDAVVRNFEIIGEATRQLPQRIKDKYPAIEWKLMIAFRNVIIHEYFGINLKIMWDIIENELPLLKQKLKKIHVNPPASVRKKEEE